jgi:predicted deacylase
LRTKIPLGSKITANQKIGEIADPFDEHETAVISPAAGIVIGRLNLPLVHEGDALFHVAGFDDSAAISESLNDFKEEIRELTPAQAGG